MNVGMGTGARNSFSGDICLEFSVLFLCSVQYDRFQEELYIGDNGHQHSTVDVRIQEHYSVSPDILFLGLFIASSPKLYLMKTLTCTWNG
jgi:hypothetical protein